MRFGASRNAFRFTVGSIRIPADSWGRGGISAGNLGVAGPGCTGQYTINDEETESTTPPTGSGITAGQAQTAKP